MVEDLATCTVAHLIGEPGLGISLVTSGADLTRPIRWVQTTELVDPKPYLRHDELVCTVGSSLSSAAAIQTFVEAVAGCAAAVCFGLGDVHERPPKGLVETCERAGLPLLTLPYGIAFLDIADVVDRLRGEATEAEALGRIIELIQSGLARPQSLRDVLAEHSLEPVALVVASWPRGSAANLIGHFEAGLVAETSERTVTISGSLAPVLTAARSTTLRCGFADPADLADLGSALFTSQLALAAAPVGGEPCGPDDVTSFALLLDGIPEARLRPFVVHLIEPLIAAGDHASPTYLETLRTFLEQDLSVGRTAKEQFLHVNTVRHRLWIIKGLTGRDPFVTTDLLALAVAVQAHDHNLRRR